MVKGSLSHQVAYLAVRVDQVRALPMIQRVNCVEELLALQLALLGEMAQAIETLQSEVERCTRSSVT